jgi:hypothetical protein
VEVIFLNAVEYHWIYRASCKTWCRHVAQFCHPLQTKRNTKSKKHSCKINACSQLGFNKAGFFSSFLL